MEILSHIAAAKSQEYIIAIGFLTLFIFYWRMTMVPRARLVAAAAAVKGLGTALGDLAGGFSLPRRLFYHQGHGWVRVDDGNVVSVGLDDFAQKLVGQIDSAKLPDLGSTVKQGQTGWTLYVGNEPIEMLSPVDGRVVAVNEKLASSTPEKMNQDPYGEGWLMKVEAPGLSANLTNLLSGEVAKRWMEKVRDNLTSRMTPDLGPVFQDGGIPIDSMARNLDQDRWHEIAREFLLTSEKASILY